MTYVTDLTHLDGVLAPNSRAPAPAKRLATFLTEVVRVASRETDDGSIATDIRCFKKPGHKACPGRICTTRERSKQAILWRCPACGVSGVINNWRGGPADLTEFADGRVEVVPKFAEDPSPWKLFQGRWRILEMELWRQETFELMGSAFFEFDDERAGGFQFVAVQGGLDCHYAERDGQPLVEFTWEGEDEGDARSGRGWATILEDGSLTGRFFFHAGDDSAFRATRMRRQSH